MKNIGVFFGSSSPEHDVSIVTGELIIATLKKMGYQATPIYLTKERKWLIGEEFGSLKYFAGGKNVDDGAAEYLLDLSQTAGEMVFRKKGLVKKEIRIDLAFPAFHGAYGEDGTIQGLFEMIGVPYVGCDVAASALAMDKALTKALYEQAGIPTVKYQTILKYDFESNPDEYLQMIGRELSFPVFVKPARLGSSIGIQKVKAAGDELQFAIEAALFYDEKVVVEEAVNNLMDVTCCVIGNHEPQASLLQESSFQAELFDFNEKYLSDGGAQLGNAKSSIIIPAGLPEDVTSAIQALSLKIYKLFCLSGISRIDYLYDKDSGKYYANEINTLPGTLYHHLWKASGIEIEELVRRLLECADERFKEKKALNLTFESKLLQNLDSQKLQATKLQN